MPSSIGSCSDYVTFIDNFTRMVWIAFIKEKADTARAIHAFIVRSERQFEKKVKHLFTDNGGEYVNHTVHDFLANRGIVHDFAPVYGHEYKGLAERYNYTLLTMVRMMLL